MLQEMARVRSGQARPRGAYLPLDVELVTALTALRRRPLDKSTAAGPAYRSGLGGWNGTRAVNI
jgi:hypothetical protein